MSAVQQMEKADISSVARHRDLRDWIAQVDRMGELRRIDHASWDLEIGSITDYVSHHRPNPAVLFDNIQGYPAGYRVLVNQLGSLRRLAYTWGVPEGLDTLGMIQAWRRRVNAKAGEVLTVTIARRKAPRKTAKKPNATFGMWADREDASDPGAYLRALRTPVYSPYRL